MKCRHCKEQLSLELIDLGSAPPSNSYLKKEGLSASEKWFPLRVLVCTNCWLTQTDDIVDANDMFTDDYAYLSSFSDTLLRYASDYVDICVKRFDLDAGSRVVEVAANDGYLLQYVRAKGIPCFGIEPTHVAAEAARSKGIDIVERFFGEELGEELAAKGLQADLMAANNVLAHVPDINDFVKGFTRLLKPDGVVSFENPHLMQMLEKMYFDIIYHEHFSYPSLTSVTEVLKSNGLSVFDIEEIDLQGGSMRVYAQRSDTGRRPVSDRVTAFLERERKAGLMEPSTYTGFPLKVQMVKNDFLDFLIRQKREGKTVCAYGAAAKGNTFLNYAGIRKDYISYVVDRNPEKVGKFMPGSRIPIVDVSMIRQSRPDFVVILPWNLRNEVMGQLEYIGEWGGRFVVALPSLEVMQGTPQPIVERFRPSSPQESTKAFPA
jgi:SAM-dependent methyltransferase